MNRHRHYGLAAVETTLVLPTLFVLFLATCDLGLMAFRQHAIDHAAAYAAGTAAKHGELATLSGVWGPDTINEPATATNIPIVDAIADYLITCDLANTRVVGTWPDGSNAADAVIIVEVTTVHRHLIPLLGADKALWAQHSAMIEH